MKSCSQDVELIKKALRRRTQLFCKQDVPDQEELYKIHGEALAGVVLKEMSQIAKHLMNANIIHKPPNYKLWISPESRIKKKICITEASHVDQLKALTHNGVTELGALVEKKYEKKFLKTLKKAIEETSEFERFECERRLKFALKVQEDIYLKKLSEIEDKLYETFNQERLETQALYDSKYGEILNEVINSTREKYQNIIDDLKMNCTCGTDSEVFISSTSVSTVSSLKMSSGSTPSLEPDVKMVTGKNEGPIVDVAKRLWNDFEHHLRTQRNILQCSNASDLVHFICTEKLESQRRLETVQKEACEKIELLKNYLFDICCKIRNIDCQCPKEEVQKPICLGMKYCRCKHQRIPYISKNKSEEVQLICSCCAKKIDNKNCDGENPKEDQARTSCNCPVKATEFEKIGQNSLDAKLFCCCEYKIEEESTQEKKLCYVCRAKKICAIVQNMTWPQPPKPPCICPGDKLNPCTQCQCKHSNNKKSAKRQDQDFAAAAIIFPEGIGKEMFCECHSSSSEDECTCLEKEDLQAKNKNFVDVSWKLVEDNECVQLIGNNGNKSSSENCSEAVGELEEYEKKSITESDSSLSTPTQIPVEELKKKLIRDLDAGQLVDCIFAISSEENLKNPEYIKMRLAEEVENRIQKIFTHEKPKEEMSQSYSQGSTSATTISQKRFIDDLLKVKRKREAQDIEKDIPNKTQSPVSAECKLDETTRDISKNYIRLPKYMVPMASLLEGGWCYSQTTDEDWKIITKLIEENKSEEKCFLNKDF